MILSNYSDIEKLEIPEDIAALPGFDKLKTTIRLLKEEVGSSYPIQTSVVGSFSMPPILMGMDKWI